MRPGWALFRGLLYAIGFFTVIVALGLVESWWALLALPATVFVGFAFAGMGVAAVTFMRSWQDFDILNLAILPMFLFSATFFPLSTYPDWLEVAIQATPLYHGVELLRSLTTGTVGVAQLGNVAYLTVLGLDRHLDCEPARRKTPSDLTNRFSVTDESVPMAQDRPSARIYPDMGSDSLQSVRCLGCGAVYGKPSGGGTLTRNPGCPGCGYVGWLSLTDGQEALRRGHSVADLQQRRRATAG